MHTNSRSGKEDQTKFAQENGEVRSVLVVLLLLYFVGRVLQLFAGHIPSLLIVVLHVVPPGLFALVHGTRVYRARGILVFTTACLASGAFFESLSLKTGFPFGHYRFTDLMGPKLFDLPVLLVLAYLGMGYLSWILGLAMLGSHEKPLSGKKIVLLPLLASFVMTAWDLSMDPIWANIDHAWEWHDGGAYFGVPISNFLGWLLTAYVFYQLFALYLKNKPVTGVRTSHWRLPILFYAISAAGNLLVVVPGFLGEVFVDASGRRWTYSSTLLASRLVSVFLMLPLSVLAWVKASRGSKPFMEQGAHAGGR